MFFKSIRFKVLAWYILLLTVTLFSFSTVLYGSFSKVLVNNLDDLLSSRAEGVADSMHAYWHDKDIAPDIEQFLNIVKAAGAIESGKDMEVYLSKGDEDFAKAFLKSQGIGEGGPFIILNPGGNWELKRWPAENFASLGDRLREKYGMPIMLTGAGKDVALAENIAGMMKQRPVIAAGTTTLRQLAAIMKRAALVVSNDSGPMHIAVATGAKVIALFGPTSPGMTGPYGAGNYRVVKSRIECDVPCYDVTCTDNRCMKAISVEEVMASAQDILGKNL